jgi:hypothetical protein
MIAERFCLIEELDMAGVQDIITAGYEYNLSNGKYLINSADDAVGPYLE